LPENQEELLTEYIATACRILHNVGLTPEGVTSPGGFGGRPLELYAKLAGIALREVTGNPTPYFFKRFAGEGTVEVPVWYADREAGTAVGEILASTGDWTGSWTGYDEVSVDRYITSDLQGGRIPALVNAGEPVIFCSHWQGFYGMHNDDRRGFNTLKAVVRRLNELDPKGIRTQWRKCSEITNYSCAREMAEIKVEGDTIKLDLPVRVPDLTLRLSDADIKGISVDGKPLRKVSSHEDFKSGTFIIDGDKTLVAFDPERRNVEIKIEK